MSITACNAGPHVRFTLKENAEQCLSCVTKGLIEKSYYSAMVKSNCRPKRILHSTLNNDKWPCQDQGCHTVYPLKGQLFTKL